MGNSAASVEPAAGFDDLAVGIVGTGMMATAHATAWSSLGMKVYIGSRDAERGQALARKIGNGCKGGTHAEMLEESNFILLCVHPGQDSWSFITDTLKPLASGKGKMICDMSASYTRFCTDAQRAPEPHKSSLTYHKELLGDSTASWVKSWANVMAQSISNFNRQPMEVAGDDAAKKMAFRMLTAAGFEPLDCGNAEDAKGIEPCSAPFNRPERVRHPRHLAHNGPNHP